MRPIKVIVRNAKATDPKQLNVINRLQAYAYAFGLKVETVELPTMKVPCRLDFDAEGLSAKDIKSYSSICSQLSSILYYSNNLWDLTKLYSKPEDSLSEIQKTRKRAQVEKAADPDYFKEILNHYDQVWYLKNILEKKEYEADEKINWQLNKKEIFALRRLIPQINDKVLLSGVEWSSENAVASFDALLTASLVHPYKKNLKENFSLTNFEYDFLKIYRHVRTKIKPAGTSRQFDNLDSRFDRFFADDNKGRSTVS